MVPPSRGMNAGGQPARQLGGLRHRCTILLVLAAFLLPGCDSPPPSLIDRGSLPHREVGGFQVPVFPTAEEQLDYTRSSFDSAEQKAAALRAVADYFPEAAEQRGAAALDLAYLLLGDDYRQAKADDCRRAIAAFEAVVVEHPGSPHVCARASWYMGWIAAQLIGDKGRGLEYFQAIVDRWPEAEMKPPMTLPLVSIMGPPDHPEKAAGQEEQRFWAHLALLEMIRHGEDEAAALAAWRRLQDAAPRSRFAVIGLRTLLQRQGGDPATLRHAREYLASPVGDPLAEADIRALLEGKDAVVGEGKGP